MFECRQYWAYIMCYYSYLHHYMLPTLNTHIITHPYLSHPISISTPPYLPPDPSYHPLPHHYPSVLSTVILNIKTPIQTIGIKILLTHTHFSYTMPTPDTNPPHQSRIWYQDIKPTHTSTIQCINLELTLPIRIKYGTKLLNYTHFHYTIPTHDTNPPHQNRTWHHNPYLRTPNNTYYMH